jgi:hypothetical protein
MRLGEQKCMKVSYAIVSALFEALFSCSKLNDKLCRFTNEVNYA